MSKGKTGGNRAGGGIASRQHKSVGVRNGMAAKGSNPRAVSQIGGSFGNHATGHMRPVKGAVEEMHNKPTPAGGGQMLGNQKALDVGKGGPGTGRVVDKCGSQGCY